MPERLGLRLGVMVAACRSFNKARPNAEGELKLRGEVRTVRCSVARSRELS